MGVRTDHGLPGLLLAEISLVAFQSVTIVLPVRRGITAESGAAPPSEHDAHFISKDLVDLLSLYSAAGAARRI